MFIYKKIDGDIFSQGEAVKIDMSHADKLKYKTRKKIEFAILCLNDDEVQGKTKAVCEGNQEDLMELLQRSGNVQQRVNRACAAEEIQTEQDRLLPGRSIFREIGWDHMAYLYPGDMEREELLYREALNPTEEVIRDLARRWGVNGDYVRKELAEVRKKVKALNSGDFLQMAQVISPYWIRSIQRNKLSWKEAFALSREALPQPKNQVSKRWDEWEAMGAIWGYLNPSSLSELRRDMGDEEIISEISSSADDIQEEEPASGAVSWDEVVPQSSNSVQDTTISAEGSEFGGEEGEGKIVDTITESETKNDSFPSEEIMNQICEVVDFLTQEENKDIRMEAILAKNKTMKDLVCSKIKYTFQVKDYSALKVFLVVLDAWDQYKALPKNQKKGFRQYYLIEKYKPNGENVGQNIVAQWKKKGGMDVLMDKVISLYPEKKIQWEKREKKSYSETEAIEHILAAWDQYEALPKNQKKGFRQYYLIDKYKPNGKNVGQNIVAQWRKKGGIDVLMDKVISLYPEKKIQWEKQEQKIYSEAEAIEHILAAWDQYEDLPKNQKKGFRRSYLETKYKPNGENVGRKIVQWRKKEGGISRLILKAFLQLHRNNPKYFNENNVIEIINEFSSTSTTLGGPIMHHLSLIGNRQSFLNFIHPLFPETTISEQAKITSHIPDHTSKHPTYIIQTQNHFQGLIEWERDEITDNELLEMNKNLAEHEAFVKFFNHPAEATRENHLTNFVHSLDPQITAFQYKQQINDNPYCLKGHKETTQPMLIGEVIEGQSGKDFFRDMKASDDEEANEDSLQMAHNTIETIIRLHNKWSEIRKQELDKSQSFESSKYRFIHQKGHEKLFPKSQNYLSEKVLDSINFGGFTGYVHGDLHTGNLWVNYEDEEPQVRLIDFESLGKGNVLMDLEPLLEQFDDETADELLRKYWNDRDMTRSESEIIRDKESMQALRLRRYFIYSLNLKFKIDGYMKEIKQIHNTFKNTKNLTEKARQELEYFVAEAKTLIDISIPERKTLVSLIPESAPDAFIDEINAAFDHTETLKKLKFYDSLPSSCSYRTQKGSLLSFDSRAERQVGLLLEKIIPNFELKTGKTFQKKSKGTKNFKYDFVIPVDSEKSIIIEYHPMYWETLKKGNEGKSEATLRKEYMTARSRYTDHPILLLEKCPLDMSEFAAKLQAHLPEFANIENIESFGFNHFS